jgi:copper chaperone CopZ
MQQSFELSGVHCMHCVQTVKKALTPLADEVEVTLSPAVAVLTSKEPVSTEAVNKALAAAGDFKAQPLD